MAQAVVAGVGMTRFGRFPEVATRLLTVEAMNRALVDGGIAADEVDLVVHGNALAGLLQGQEMIRAEVALGATKLAGKPMINVENACASGSTALHVATMAITSGAADVVLAIGAEKLSHPDRRRTADALAGALDTEHADEIRQAVGVGGTGESMMMDIYADLAQRYSERSGATNEDFARVAVKNRWFAARNPLAQFRSEVTVREVLDSRIISGPLTLLMCSPIGDGAAALVLMSPERARTIEPSTRVHVRACVLATGVPNRPDGPSVITMAARRAYEESGISPLDADVAEVHDGAAPGELMAYEELELCAEGEGAKLLISRDTSLGGRCPVNTSGGLLGRGHPVGATGCAQVVELVQQLRGRCGDRQVEGARVAVAENHGGYVHPDPAVAAVTILTAD